MIVLVIITFLTYVSSSSGTPTTWRRASPDATPTPPRSSDAAVRLGLNHGFWYQYWHYLVGLLHGSFGLDYQNQVPINSEIARAFPVTASLVLGAAVIWLLIGIPIGIMSATHPRTLRDRAGTTFALTFLSMPTFVLGVLFLLVLYYYLTRAGLSWFPAAGYVPLTQSPVQWAVHLILPVVHARPRAGGRLHTTDPRARSSTCWARTTSAPPGPRGSAVAGVYKHGVRAALTPVVTQLGIDVGTLLAGAFVTEHVFGLTGLGQLALNAIGNGDLPVVAAVVVLAASFIVIMNTLVDILYAVLDPRVRLT